jgi:hypothetical protein
MAWRLSLPLSLLLFTACSSSPTCNPVVDLFVELPGGTDAISSIEVTGACAPTSGGCVPVSASCETAKCDCKVAVQVNETTFGPAQMDVCHIRVISKAGAVFMRDLAFASAGGSCFNVSGPSGTVAVDFSDAGIVDGGFADAGDAD